MKTHEELINSIKIIEGNLEHISKTGKVNGSLQTEITRVINEFLESRTVNFDKEKLRAEFDEYMMTNMKPFTPENTFEWFFAKLEELGAFVAYPTNSEIL